MAYNEVYDFTNENVACLKELYHFENSKVISMIGSGDQYFASKLYGANQVDLFDVNQTSYLYFILKFYAIRELTYEEFYNFFINKKINNINVYNKLEPVLPKEVLQYYKYLLEKNKRMLKKCFRLDGINLLSKANKIYYFNREKQIIPYLIKDEYYKLQNILKNTNLPNFYPTNFIDLKYKLTDNYDIMLLSNIYNWLPIYLDEFTEMLKSFDIPEIQACYDWGGRFLKEFVDKGYSTNKVIGSAPTEYGLKENYIYSLYK